LLVAKGIFATGVQGSAVSGVGRGSWLRQQSDLNGVALDANQHPAEHQVMEREHRVPVGQTEQPAGPEQSCLVEDALAFVTWFYSEVEQRFAR
jgi:hypothetical protein